MLVFAGISGLLSVAVGWLVTARLFALARRTGAAPERLLAIAFGGLFCVGYPLAGASRAPGLALTYEGSLLFTIGALGMAIGIAALGRFPFVVFRPSARWAEALSLAISAAGVIGGLGCAASVTFATSSEEMVSRIQPWALALMGAVCASFLWNAIESFRYHGVMKRRQAIGLATAETTHRFLLWGLASGLAVLSVGGIAGLRAVGVPILSSLPMALIGSTTLVTTSCWAIAFFMPDAYRRHVLGGTNAGSDTLEAETE